MSNVTKEYLVVLLYFLLLLAQAAGETVWLRRKGWLNGAKSALLLVGVTDFIGFVVGFTVLFISVGITFALAWMVRLVSCPWRAASSFRFSCWCDYSCPRCWPCSSVAG